MRALGLDVGEKRIGLAVGDTESNLAVPIGAVNRVGGPHDFQEVVAHATSRRVDLLVVGMPWSLNGRAGPQARVVAAFVETLRQHTSLPVVTWDERFTSVEAGLRLQEVEGQHRQGSRSKGRARLARGANDAAAAAVMLQAYMDAQRHGRPTSAEEARG